MKKKEFKILLVDDEPDILEIISYNLNKEGFQVATASNGIEAIKVALKTIPHLIILDIMMPQMDGIETCRKLRANSLFNNTIITFLTARNEDYSMVSGLSVGADDYITKPIKPKVLLAKINSLLRRVPHEIIKKNASDSSPKISIDYDAYIVYVNDEKISLPKKEFMLFSLLYSKPDKVFKREEILMKVWGNYVVVGDRTIDVHIRKLRKKLGSNCIKTIKGVGYKFLTDEI